MLVLTLRGRALYCGFFRRRFRAGYGRLLWGLGCDRWLFLFLQFHISDTVCLRHAEFADQFFLPSNFLAILVNLRFILDDGVPCRTHFVNLTAKIVFGQWRQPLRHALSVAFVSSLVQIGLTTSILLKYTWDVDMSIRGALDRFLVLVNLFHLLSNVLLVQVWRNAQFI